MMGIDRKNSERYPDPTCYQALVTICKREKRNKRNSRYTPGFKPLVYICTPYAGDKVKNAANAKRYCRFAYRHNAIPIAPHLLYPQFLNDDDTEERNAGMWMGLILLNKCNELWVFGTVISSGMKAEIDRAKKNNMYIRYFDSDLKEVF